MAGLIQASLAKFLRTGGLRCHSVRVGREYAHRRSFVIAATAHLASHVRLDAIEGGLHATVSWDDGTPAEHVAALLAQRGIQVTSLDTYYHPDTHSRRNGVVFGYGPATDLQLRRALQEIVTVINTS